MKYIRTALSDQETIINFFYDEQIIKVYSSRAEVINILTKVLGQPTIKYKKSKSYWTGASWDIKFSDYKKIEKILVIKNFVDSSIKVENSEGIKKNKNSIKKNISKDIEKKEDKLRVKKEKIVKNKEKSQKIEKTKKVEENKKSKKVEENKKSKKIDENKKAKKVDNNQKVKKIDNKKHELNSTKKKKITKINLNRKKENNKDFDQISLI